MRQSLNAVYTKPSMQRRYEAWFLRLGLADGSAAWWFRYLLMNPARAGCPGHLRALHGEAYCWADLASDVAALRSTMEWAAALKEAPSTSASKNSMRRSLVCSKAQKFESKSGAEGNVSKRHLLSAKRGWKDKAHERRPVGTRRFALSRERAEAVPVPVVQGLWPQVSFSPGQSRYMQRSLPAESASKIGPGVTLSRKALSGTRINIGDFATKNRDRELPRMVAPRPLR